MEDSVDTTTSTINNTINRRDHTNIMMERGEWKEGDHIMVNDYCRGDDDQEQEEEAEVQSSSSPLSSNKPLYVQLDLSGRMECMMRIEQELIQQRESERRRRDTGISVNGNAMVAAALRELEQDIVARNGVTLARSKYSVEDELRSLEEEVSIVANSRHSRQSEGDYSIPSRRTHSVEDELRSMEDDVISYARSLPNPRTDYDLRSIEDELRSLEEEIMDEYNVYHQNQSEVLQRFHAPRYKAAQQELRMLEEKAMAGALIPAPLAATTTASISESLHSQQHSPSNPSQVLPPPPTNDSIPPQQPTTNTPSTSTSTASTPMFFSMHQESLGARLGPGAFSAEPVDLETGEVRRTPEDQEDYNESPNQEGTTNTNNGANLEQLRPTTDHTGIPTTTSHLVEAHTVEELVEAHAKPLEWWTPKKVGIAICLLVGMLAIGGFFASKYTIQNRDDNDNDNYNRSATSNPSDPYTQDQFPTLAPQHRRNAVHQIIIEHYQNQTKLYNNIIKLDPNALDDPATPQHWAWRWIAEVDDYQVPIHDVDDLVQRYVLAVLYYATGGQDAWTEQVDFLQPKIVCFWGPAVQCDENQSLTRLDLNHAGLTGTLPQELALLTNLQQLHLGHNELTGHLPPLLQLQSTLSSLDLSDNHFSGFIPYHYTELTVLKTLHLNANNLSGEIPSGLGDLTQLTSLNLEKNFLCGSIPSNLWRGLTNLEYFNLNTQRMLNGRISKLVGQWSNLRVFHLQDLNRLKGGTIPTEVGLLTNLREFYTTQSKIEGALPSEFGSLTLLEVLDISRNGLTGTVPTELSRLTNLHQLYLQNNYLSGDMDAFCHQAANMSRLTAAVADLQKVDCFCCTCCGE